MGFVGREVEVEIVRMEGGIGVEEIKGVKNELGEFSEGVNKGESCFGSLGGVYCEDGG